MSLTRLRRFTARLRVRRCCDFFRGADRRAAPRGAAEHEPHRAENTRVRVKEAVFIPDNPNPGMHTHELPHVGVIIDGDAVFRAPDGTSETMKVERGGVGYRDANVTHEPVNPGTTAVRVIEVELK